MPPVTVAVTRTVKPGCEAAFEAALHDFVQRSLREPGQRGVSILRPPPGSASREYGILRSFEDEAAREAFYASALFRAWDERVASLVEGPRSVTQVTGLEGWFSVPGHALIAPPRWKMALATLLGVYPLSVLLSFCLVPLLAGAPRLFADLVIAVTMVGSLTWVVMPVVSRGLHGWLHPAREVS